MMKYFVTSVLLASIVGCSSGIVSKVSSQQDVAKHSLLSLPADPSMVPNGNAKEAVIKPHHGLQKLGFDAKKVEALVREQYAHSAVESVTVELKTMGYARENLDAKFLELTDDSPAWVVKFDGDIVSRMPSAGIGSDGQMLSEPHFKRGVLVVDAETGLIIRSSLLKN